MPAATIGMDMSAPTTPRIEPPISAASRTATEDRFTVLRSTPQQGSHGWALVEEDADVALRLGERHRVFQRRHGGRDVASPVVGERLFGGANGLHHGLELVRL